MEHADRAPERSQHGAVQRAGTAGSQAGPGKRTLTADLAPGSGAAAPLPRLDLASARSAERPTEGLGGGDDPTLDPENDADRNTLDPDAETETDDAERNPRVDGRPIDPEHPDGWGSPYGDCHGVVAFKNIVPEASERERIAALHDGAQPGADQFGLTVPFGGALAYQCVEFVTRYYRDALGHGGLGGGHAQTFLQGSRGGLEVHRFPTPTRPQAGDLVVQEGGASPVGHVGIVQSVSGGEGGNLTVTVVQQNWGSASPVSSFEVTSRKEPQEVEGGVQREVEVYEHAGDWAGFRRKPGTAPVEERGGTAESLWLGAPDHGEGNYFVQPGKTVYLDTIARIYGVSVEDLRRFNPGIPNAVVAPAGGTPVEIRVTDSFPHSAAVIGTATCTGGGTLRGAPSTRGAQLGSLSAGQAVMVYEIVAGDQPDGFQTRDWYKIAFYTGADAYVFGGLCSGLEGASTDDAGTEGAGTEGAGTEGAGTEGAGTEGASTEGAGAEHRD